MVGAWSAVVGGTGEKGRAQQHEPQHVKGLRCWLIRCMLAKHSVFYCSPKFLPKIKFGRDRRGLPAKQVSICSTFAPAKNLEKQCVFTFSARLAQPRGQHPPHHRHHLHQCPPWMRMMQAMPGMLSTMGTPKKRSFLTPRGVGPKTTPFRPKHARTSFPPWQRGHSAKV